MDSYLSGFREQLQERDARIAVRRDTYMLAAMYPKRACRYSCVWACIHSSGYHGWFGRHTAVGLVVRCCGLSGVCSCRGFCCRVLTAEGCFRSKLSKFQAALMCKLALWQRLDDRWAPKPKMFDT